MKEEERKIIIRVCFLYLFFLLHSTRSQPTWLLLGVSFIAFSLNNEKRTNGEKNSLWGIFINYANSGEYFLFHAVILFHLLTTFSMHNSHFSTKSKAEPTSFSSLLLLVFLYQHFSCTKSKSLQAHLLPFSNQRL